MKRKFEVRLQIETENDDLDEYTMEDYIKDLVNVGELKVVETSAGAVMDVREVYEEGR